MRMLDCEIVTNTDFVDIHFHCFNVRNSKFFIVVASLFTRSCTSDLCALFFPMNFAMYAEHEAWADKIFKRFINLRTDYQKLQHQRDPSQPLTACQQWKLTDLYYLKTFYKQGHKASRRGTSRTSTEHSSDEEADDHGQLELEDRDAYQNSCSPHSHAHKKM